MNTIRHLSQYALQELKDSYCEHEIHCICKIIYMDVLHFTNIDIHLRKNEILDESFVNKFSEIIYLLKSGHPLQYILGETEFSGLRFRLNRSTLIPRPETAELVNWVHDFLVSGQNLLDIGCGSGCISISLSHLCPGANITGIDINPETVRTAKENAALNRVNTTFWVRDILNFKTQDWELYDLIVSNPPYIRESEKETMESKVLDYEPHQALFVPDTEPLLFYHKIAEFGLIYLKKNGLLFLEINEALGPETISLLSQYGYQNIELRKDFLGKDRMIKCQLTPSSTSNR